MEYWHFHIRKNSCNFVSFYQSLDYLYTSFCHQACFQSRPLSLVGTIKPREDKITHFLNWILMKHGHNTWFNLVETLACGCFYIAQSRLLGRKVSCLPRFKNKFEMKAVKRLKVSGRFYTKIHSLHVKKTDKKSCVYILLLPDMNIHWPGVVFLGHTVTCKCLNTVCIFGC